MMANELAVRAHNGAVRRFGERSDIEQIRNRIMAMIPNAAGAPDDVLWATAQLAVAHNLNPFTGEIYVVKMGSRKEGNQWIDDWRPIIGVKGLRRKAREQSLYMTTERELTTEEVQRYRRDAYDPDDVGVEVTLVRMDIARECKRMGIDYMPVKSVGFWRKKAKSKDIWKNNQKAGTEWVEDSIPNGQTAIWVATKRAEVDALKKAFDLTFDTGDPGMIDDDATVTVLAPDVPDDSPELPKYVEYEEDGDVLWASDNKARKAPPAPAVVEPAPEPTPEPEPAPVAELPAVVASWTKPEDAYIWAVGAGAVDGGVNHAKNVFGEIVREKFDKKFTTRNAGEVYTAFYYECLRRAAEAEEAAQAAKDDDANPFEEVAEMAA